MEEKKVEALTTALKAPTSESLRKTMIPAPLPAKPTYDELVDTLDKVAAYSVLQHEGNYRVDEDVMYGVRTLLKRVRANA
jgi:hypothetical protein